MATTLSPTAKSVTMPSANVWWGVLSGSRTECGTRLLLDIGPWSIRYLPIDRFDISDHRWRGSGELHNEIAPRVVREQKLRTSMRGVLRKDRLDSNQRLPVANCDVGEPSAASSSRAHLAAREAQTPHRSRTAASARTGFAHGLRIGLCATRIDDCPLDRGADSGDAGVFEGQCVLSLQKRGNLQCGLHALTSKGALHHG
jgi:hypothetical protein